MNINSILKNTIICGIFATLFIPLYVSDSMFFPFITGKNFLFRIIVEVIFASWLILMYKDAFYRPKKTWLLIAMSVFVLIVAVADIFGENPTKSFWSNYERMEGLVAHLHFLVYFFVVSSVFTTQKLWDKFLQTSIFASALVGFYGLGQLAGIFEIHQGGVRLDATLGNSTYLAIYMLFNIFLAGVYILRRETDSLMRYVYGAVVLLELFILYHTATRGAILGLLGGAVVTSLLFVILNKENARLRKISLATIVIVFVLICSVFLFKDSKIIKNSPVLSRFGSISLKEETTKSRFLIWNMSLQGVKENPILGWGQENYILVFNKYYDPKMYGQEPWFDRSHNVFFDWLINAGILGLLSYLSLFVIALYQLLRKGSSFLVTEKALIVGLLLGYLFQNIFVFDNLVSYLLFFSLLAYINFRGMGKIEESKIPSFINKKGTKGNEKETFMGIVYTPLVLVLFLFVLYFINIKPILASSSLISALRAQQTLDKNLEYFKEAIDYGTLGLGEIREQLIQATLRMQDSNFTPEAKQKFFELSEVQMAKQIEDNPKDARYQFFFGAFLNRFGLQDEAIKHLEIARTLSPKKQSIIFELGSSYLGKGDYKKAFSVIKEAYDLEPNYEEARVLYGVAALYAHEDKIAESTLLPIYGTLMIPDDRIINAYAVRGEYGKVVTLLKTRADSDPTNYGYHLNLAAAYLKTGDRQSSIDEINKVIKINPEFKDQGEYYIKEIKAGRNP